MKNENNIDKAFRKKLENFGKNPPENIWAGIEGGLAAGNAKKGFIFYLRIAAGILIILGIGTSLYHFYPSGKNVNLTGLNPEEKNRILLKEQENKPLQQEKEDDLYQIQQAENYLKDNKDTNSPQSQKNKYEQRAGSELNEKNLPSEAIKIENRMPVTSNLINEIDSESESVIEYELRINKSGEDINFSKDATRDGNTVLIANMDILDNRSKKGISELPVQIQIPVAEDKIKERKTKKSVSWDMIMATQTAAIAPDKESGPRLSLSAVMTPLYSYRNISKSDTKNIGYFNDSEKGKINYSGGLQFGVKASSRLSFQTGLVYSRLGIGVENIYTYAQRQDYAGTRPDKNNEEEVFMASNSIGTISQGKNTNKIQSSNQQKTDQITTSTTEGSKDIIYSPSKIPVDVDGKLDQYFHILELPLMLRYKVIDRDIDINLLGGLSTNYLLSSESFINSGNENTYLGPTKNIRSFNYSGNVGFGLDYNFIESFIFTFEPQFKYYLHSINEDNYISARPYSFGVYTGIKFIF